MNQTYSFLVLQVNNILVIQCCIKFTFVGVGAAWRTAGVEPGSTVAIFGLGSVGLAVWILLNKVSLSLYLCGC